MKQIIDFFILVGREVIRNILSILIVVGWIFYWGVEDALNTISLVVGVLAFAMLLGHFAGKMMFSSYGWDVGRRLNDAWHDRQISHSILAVAMLLARVAIYSVIVIGMALMVMAMLGGKGYAAVIPDRAAPYVSMLKQEHQRLWPESDVAILASQIHQESAWKERAIRHERPGYVSYGLFQVLNTTFDGMKKQYPLLDSKPAVIMLQARWSMRAGILYDKQMWNSCRFASGKYNRWAMTLSAYNGGFGWLQKDRVLTESFGYDKNYWSGNVELFSRRASWAMVINRKYPREIFERVPAYRAYIGG